jgi:hypothetical protein
MDMGFSPNGTRLIRNAIAQHRYHPHRHRGYCRCPSAAASTGHEDLVRAISPTACAALCRLYGPYEGYAR